MSMAHKVRTTQIATQLIANGVTIPLPTDQYVQLLGLQFLYTATGVGVARNVYAYITNRDGSVIYTVGDLSVITAGAATRVCFSPQFHAPGTMDIGGGPTSFLPLPSFWLPEGCSLALWSANAQAADTISQGALTWRAAPPEYLIGERERVFDDVLEALRTHGR